jgi:hypothetical protein
VAPRSARLLEPGRDVATSMSIAERYAPFTFAHVVRSVTVRLNTGRSPVQSPTSLTK